MNFLKVSCILGDVMPSNAPKMHMHGRASAIDLKIYVVKEPSVFKRDDISQNPLDALV